MNVQTIPVEGLNLARVPNEFGVHIVVAFIEQDCIPFTSTGLAARASLADAIRHATLEAVLSRLWNCEWLSKNEFLNLDAPKTMIDNALLHATERRFEMNRLRWLDPEITASDSPDENDWTDICNRFPETVFVDLTTNDVALTGHKVVRVVDPNLVLNDDDPKHSRLGGNLSPHPFG